VKLLRLGVGGFGPLRGEWSFARDKLNLIVDDNERGKTSMLAAIAAALYGLEDDRRSHRVLTPLERWRPWTGGAYKVELELEVLSRRLRILRDFEAGTVAVFDDKGREVTAEFLDGRDAYPVGQKLLGMDAGEFEKCALVRQGDLDAVVPGDERTRRASTLRARLENAADTHIGDTNASEALRVLDEALRRYDAPELEFTGTIDNALKGLEARAALIDADLHELDHQIASASGPLEQMAQLADEEHDHKEALRRLDEERRGSLAAEVLRQLDENDRNRTELETLEHEAAGLEAVARMPVHSESELRDAVARIEEAQRNLETLESRRGDEIARERENIQRELAALEAYAGYTEDDANRGTALAADLRRIQLEESHQRRQVFDLRDGLAGQGYEPERIQFLAARFSGLPEEQQRMLRRQADTNLDYQTEIARLERERTEASEMLRGVEGARSGRRVPGWFAFALGLGAAVAGAVTLGLKLAPMLYGALLGAGAAVALLGATLLFIASRSGAVERDGALRRLAEAQRKLNGLRTQRAEMEAGLADLSRLMGYRDSVDLMRHWHEYARVLEDSAPLARAQEMLASCEAQRRQLLEGARPLLRAVGDQAVSPETFEKLAYEVRRAVNVRERLSQLERSFEWVGKERAVDEAAIAGLRERAMRILQGAGLTYDPERSWADHLADLAERTGRRQRWATLNDELVPAARRRLLPESEVEHRRRQLELLKVSREGFPDARPAVEIDIEANQRRGQLEAVQRRRTDLRVEVEEAWRRHATQRPELEAQRARVARAVARARAFRDSVELARTTIQKVSVDTHRKWADFLNTRVAELLERFGTRVNQLRFGEDLDFSVQLDGGPLVSRGKAHQQLSAGARDQLYLAVRLAVSEFLSRGSEALPLLIDDAFATSDDHRLAAGMRTLIEGFATGHQMLVATCHRGRHTELRRADPELYRQMVHWLDVGAPAASRT
jgi:DNA repair exonuclease SbcCD ATPase subunit